MDSRIQTWLFDNFNSIEEIEPFLGENPRNFYAYQNDKKTKRAAERSLEIIGEVVNRFLIEKEGRFAPEESVGV
jgi:uncharacterized protein with HEPN domain